LILLLLISILELNNNNKINLISLLSKLNLEKDNIFLIEFLNYIEHFKFLHKTHMLNGLGFVLFTENKLAVILASLLLLLSMIGAIVITISSNAQQLIKLQELNKQFNINYSKIN